MNNLLEGLNENQLKAVMTNDRPLRIIAGAGSGKTKVITTKIAYLINDLKIPSWKILAVTFTNKAAKEMKDRVQKILSNNEDRLFISTFHSFCTRVLREDFISANLEKNFLIIDTNDQQQIIKKIIKELNLNQDQDNRKLQRFIISRISYWKNHLISPQEARDEVFDPNERNAVKVYRVYQETLLTNNQVDFDDLQVKVYQMFNNNPEVLEKWRSRFEYVMVDEFQDTNELQFDLIKFLTKNKNNLTVVGDPDQTIYSWRGAQVNIILNFEKSYKNALTVVLDRNYRSTQQILDLANSFISHNKNREEKNIYTDNTNGEIVEVKEVATRYMEAKSVGAEIQELIKSKKYNYNDIFVLYRMNAWSQEFEKVFANLKIPFQLIGGIKFRERKVIKDAMAFLKVIAVKDNLSMERILHLTPKVGEVTIEKIISLANEHHLNILDLIINEDQSLINSITKNLDKLRTVLIEALKLYKLNSSLEELLKFVLVESGYENKVLLLDDDKDDIKNIYAFYDQLNKFDLDFNSETFGEENKLLAFLQEEALLSEEEDDLQPNKVTLLTIHAAKGLESKVVFIAGLNRDVFPSKLSMFTIAQLEEERRALYVALTRAKEKLYISYVKGEFSYISQGELGPSKFIGELNKNLYSLETNIFVHGDGVITSNKTIVSSRFENFNKNDSSKDYQKGDMVSHMIFGDGVVVKIVDQQLQIAFNNPKFGVMLIASSNPVLKKK
ncbi:ATP-dependent DNA helicase [Williamsoniiplasma somnilux]|uniref:DNA 3'-5' helicase n=1 Tax=Williamsoniiplasma somnilux TaxID=215578 RepID=A0A2K8NZN2_9MOLU|nr:UvrD-helicase domain-containing protein [Williamsoniiplasma somnilux]ATZ19006.1 ATP-dependent DNA helicase [Williamsoniiplasma somnilux]